MIPNLEINVSEIINPVKYLIENKYDSLLKIGNYLIDENGINYGNILAFFGTSYGIGLIYIALLVISTIIVYNSEIDENDLFPPG